MTLRAWVRDLADLLLPAGCVACRTWVPRGASLVCAPCRTRLRAAPWPRCVRCGAPTGSGRAGAEACLECAHWPDALYRARCAYLLAPPATDIVHSLKYEGWREAADFVAEALADTVRRDVIDPREELPLLVAMPTTERRRRSRGYNQAGEITARLAERTGCTVRHALLRQDGAPSQTELAPSERRRNVRGAFHPAPDARAVRGRHVLLVDDVLTTGATAAEAATVLTTVGAAAVTAVAFARALPTRRRDTP